MENRTLFLVHLLISIHVWVTIQCNPIVVPSGMVPVLRGQNKTLSCSYEGQGTDLTSICVWESGRNGTFNYKVYIQQSPNGTCIKQFGNESKYGYSCQGSNVFTITIYNIGADRNGEQWLCRQVIGSTGDYQKSNQITIEVQDKTSISRFDVSAFPNQTIVAINELETVVIVCEVFSNPRSTVRLKQNHMATILVERDNVLQIEYVIQNASCSDAAVYTCSGFNNYTNLERTPSKELQLLVKCSPRPSDSLEHLKRNFTGYVHGNVTFTFMAVAYPPPMFEWQTWNGTSYNKVNRGSHFITSTDLLTSLTILNIQVDDYVSYILEVSNGIAPNLREHFYLNPQDVPQCPTNFSLLSKSTTMARVQWNGEFNGGLQQSFVLIYKKRSDTKYYTLTKPEDDETVIYKVEISSLEDGQLYDILLYSLNDIGSCGANTSLEVKTDTNDITPDSAPIIGGVVGGSLGVAVAVIILVFILRRRNTLNCACIMSISMEEDMDSGQNCHNGDNPGYNDAVRYEVPSTTKETPVYDALNVGNDGPDNSPLYTPLEDSNQKSRVYYENTKREDPVYNNQVQTVL